MKEQELTLKEIHAGMLNILQKVIEICDQLHINYYLAYGSLIGAVRHQGFIPWDDDLDIMMMRDDYDKFLAYCSKHADALLPFRLMNYHNTEGYPFAISRFCDLNYRMEMDDGNDYGMGLFIDVYPLDGQGIKVSKLKNKYLDIKKKVLSFGLYYSYDKCVIPKTGNVIKRYLRNAFCFVSRILRRQFFINGFEKMARQYSVDESKYVSCVIWDETCSFPKKWYEENIYMNFEGVKVKVPKAYHNILKQIYGDYMELPPKEKRVPHHQYKLFRK